LEDAGELFRPMGDMTDPVNILPSSTCVSLPDESGRSIGQTV